MKARVLICFALLALPATAGAATRFTIRGAGFGHGVGMSQYGAYGYALHDWTYDKILGHYYTDTALDTAASTTVRVLLQGSVSSSSFSGASSASGRSLKPGTTYYVKHGSGSGEVDLVSASGRVLKHVSSILRVRGSKLRLGGVGTYRHELEYRASGVFGVQAVNALPMESYVRGVVSRESPASWPEEALKAQAVAARTYALTTSKGGDGFDQYPDTRSQVYGGVNAETAATDAATKATAHEVVTYDGKPVTTYFFSTSGGRTENVENSVLGDEPLPWLKSVKDPYDNLSPKHRWGPFKMSMSSAAGKLSGLVKGSFKGISVTQRGVSPRIVTANVVGTGGKTRVSGATLRARFGLYDTWAYFTSISSSSSSSASSPSDDSPTGGAQPPQDRLLAGTDPQTRAAARGGLRLHGTVFPGGKGAVVAIFRRTHRGWRQVGEATTDSEGNYAYLANRAGRYRVRYLVDVGPVVRLH